MTMNGELEVNQQQPALQSVYVYKAPFDHTVLSLGEEIVDPNLNIRVPMDVIFSKNSGFKV